MPRLITIIACTIEINVAVPFFPIKAAPSTMNIMYMPPATAPPGMYSGPVIIWAKGTIIGFMAIPIVPLEPLKLFQIW